MQVHRRDFRDLVGVSSWMWIVVIILVVVEGHFPTQVRGYVHSQLETATIKITITFTIVLELED